MIDIGNPEVRDMDLCQRGDIAAWLRISIQSFDWLRRNGRAPKPCTPDGMRPKWRVGEVRRFYTTRDADPTERSETESKSE